MAVRHEFMIVLLKSIIILKVLSLGPKSIEYSVVGEESTDVEQKV
jgi:hypothetical protein